MTTDLFGEMPTSLSPRLLWMRSHNLSSCMADFDPSIHCVSNETSGVIGQGQTLDQALADWARKNGVRLWGEEGL